MNRIGIAIQIYTEISNLRCDVAVAANYWSAAYEQAFLVTRWIQDNITFEISDLL